MSEIEIAAKSVATPLVLNNWASLNEHQQLILARWIALKVMVGEQNNPEDVVFPQADRDAFHYDLVIPPRLTIRIGNCRSPDWQAAYQRNAVTLSLPPGPPPNADRKNTQTTTFGIGALLVHAMASTAPGVDLNNYITIIKLVRLWPYGGSPIAWPMFPAITSNEARSLANALDGLMLDKHVIWMPTPEKSE